ncbi:MAG: hypothetical protein ABR549_00755 [Mycobacteriales bacterium]
MRGAVWAFDVDGCVIDLLGGQSLRPLTLQVLTALSGRGCVTILWSAGGADHARRKAQQLGISEHVLACYDKGSRGQDGLWSVAHLPAHHQPQVCVDDFPEALPRHVRQIAVPPYTAPSQHDRGLAALLAELTGPTDSVTALPSNTY